MQFRIARVMRTYPAGNIVDLLYTDTGAREARVPVMAQTISTNTGEVDLPQVDPAGDTAHPIGAREMIAVVGTANNHPIVVGFLAPPQREMLFADGRAVRRHQSDVYQSIEKDGTVEFAHPSGTYVRIGEIPDHEDLSGKDVDKRWMIRENTDRAPSLRIEVQAAGVQKCTITVTPTGDLTIDARGNMDIHADGTIDISAGGNMTLTAPRIDLNP